MNFLEMQVKKNPQPGFIGGLANGDVEVKGITKRFGPFVANDHISMEVEKGEIRVILGENGAGKSTLMKILYGLYSSDEGEIILDGKNIKFKSPRQALSLGIGMIHQEFMLVDAFTVLENVMIGLQSPNSLFLKPAHRIAAE